MTLDLLFWKSEQKSYILGDLGAVAPEVSGNSELVGFSLLQMNINTFKMVLRTKTVV